MVFIVILQPFFCCIGNLPGLWDLDKENDYDVTLRSFNVSAKLAWGLLFISHCLSQPVGLWENQKKWKHKANSKGYIFLERILLYVLLFEKFRENNFNPKRFQNISQ